MATSRRAARCSTCSRPWHELSVLLPDRMLQRWWWPKFFVQDADFTRNDINYSASILYGRGGLPDAVARACRLPDRAVFRWEAPNHMVRVPCP